jgi:hypothetical protein
VAEIEGLQFEGSLGPHTLKKRKKKDSTFLKEQAPHGGSYLLILAMRKA